MLKFRLDGLRHHLYCSKILYVLVKHRETNNIYIAVISSIPGSADWDNSLYQRTEKQNFSKV